MLPVESMAMHASSAGGQVARALTWRCPAGLRALNRAARLRWNGLAFPAVP